MHQQEFFCQRGKAKVANRSAGASPAVLLTLALRKLPAGRRRYMNLNGF